MLVAANGNVHATRRYNAFTRLATVSAPMLPDGSNSGIRSWVARATSALIVRRAPSGSSTNGAVATRPDGQSASSSVNPGLRASRCHTHSVFDTASSGCSPPVCAVSTAALRSNSAWSATPSTVPATTVAASSAVIPLAARVTSASALAAEYGEKHESAPSPAILSWTASANRRCVVSGELAGIL